MEEPMRTPAGRREVGVKWRLSSLQQAVLRWQMSRKAASDNPTLKPDSIDSVRKH